MRKGFCIGMALALGVLVADNAIAAEGSEEIRELRQRLRAARQEARLAPLASETVGSGLVAQVVPPPGSYALSIDGDFDLGGFVFKDGSPFIHNDGGASVGNTALGLDALVSLTLDYPGAFDGRGNTAVGEDALRSTNSGRGNVASGENALRSNTSGSYNTATGTGALRSNTGESYNTAIGAFALYSNTTGGYYNTASGARALYSNTEGHQNTANGAKALYSNTTGVANTANGYKALYYSDLGISNTAVGAYALYRNSTGEDNTAIGKDALLGNTEGFRNIAVGFDAGSSNNYGSNNIWISNFGAEESNTLRIGQGTGTGNFQQDRAFISGIRDALGTFDQHVCTDASDQVGPCASSSARFKEDIQEMAEASIDVFGLRPVKFRYKEEFAGDGERPVQYGLIAEEVAELYPQLVTYDREGKPITVRYDALTPLLLNELKKQQRLNASQEVRIREQDAALGELRARLVRLEAGATARGRPVRTSRR